MDFLSPTEEKYTRIKEYFMEKYSKMQILRLGKSILGKDIDLYRIGKGKTQILLVGAHHASEHITASLLYYYIDTLSCSTDRFSGMDLRMYERLYSVWIVPMLNPDGVQLALCGTADNPLKKRQELMSGGSDFSDWQANARGVDLNHNYDAGFAEYKKIEAEMGISPGKGLYSGEYPESEPETRALAGFIRSIDPSLVISLHSQGEEIYAFPKSRRAEKLGRAAQDLLGYRLSAPEGTALYGGLCDYTSSLGIPSLTLEVGRGKNPLPVSEYDRVKGKLAHALFCLPMSL